MAFLGAELVITLIMASVIQKLGGYFSLAQWLLTSTGLYRYLYPENDELKSLAGVPKDKARSRKGGRTDPDAKIETFHIPRSLEIELQTEKINPLDLYHLKFYSEFQWLVDFGFYSLLVYILSEMYHSFFPLKEEFNLSMVWCLLEVLFAFKISLVLTKQYFVGDESIGERSTCIVSACAFLLTAMIILIIDEKYLETGLDTAYDSFHGSASHFMDDIGLQNAGPASKLILKLSIAFWAAILGAVFTFPGMRLAKMHWDSMRYCKENKVKAFIMNISMVMQFGLVLLWVKPICRDYLSQRIFSGMEKPLLTSQGFESLRLWMIVLTAVLRLLLFPTYMQAYLNMAYDRLKVQQKEAGRITNIDFQKKIASVFYYLCVVALQYVIPIILSLYLTLMYKTLGGYTWTGLFYETDEKCPAGAHVLQSNNFEQSSAEESIRQSAEQFQLAFDNLKKIFTTDVFRGVFGFATWWCCFTNFATTATGLIYQSYFRI